MTKDELKIKYCMDANPLIKDKSKFNAFAKKYDVNVSVRHKGSPQWAVFSVTVPAKNDAEAKKAAIAKAKKNTRFGQVGEATKCELNYDTILAMKRAGIVD